MASFKTHITVSTLAGVGYGAAAYGLFQVPWPACILAGGLCSVSGMLPDIDSGPGRPLRESLSFAAAVISTMLVDRFQQFDLSMELIVLASAAAYLLIRFGLAALLARFTVHRGMFHSLPAAVLFGEVAFLLATGEVSMRCYKAGAVVLGYVSHLVLDELYSVHYVRGRMKLKRSFGSAVKLFGREWLPNLAVYAALAPLTFLAVKEPTWIQQRNYRRQLDAATERLVEMFLMSPEADLAENDSQVPPDADAAGPVPTPDHPLSPRTTHAPEGFVR